MSTPLLRELTKRDRCDRCGAAAQIALTMKAGTELMFCGHHFSEHSAKLISLGALITGQTIGE
jgi:hypothetical protein